MRYLANVWLIVHSIAGVSAMAAEPEKVRYVRPAGDRVEIECDFEIESQGDGWRFSSTTFRGTTKMVVSARFLKNNALQSADCLLEQNSVRSQARVVVRDGKATVIRDGMPEAQFKVEPGVIVTSAPDWSDVFLLCRRYDRGGQRKQTIPALWIHPTQPCRQMVFSIELQGQDEIEREAKKVTLDRYLIEIRNNSRYAAWTDSSGRMVRLIPLPVKGTGGGLFLAGWEKACRPLSMPMP